MALRADSELNHLRVALRALFVGHVDRLRENNPAGIIFAPPETRTRNQLIKSQLLYH